MRRSSLGFVRNWAFEWRKLLLLTFFNLIMTESQITVTFPSDAAGVSSQQITRTKPAITSSSQSSDNHPAQHPITAFKNHQFKYRTRPETVKPGSCQHTINHENTISALMRDAPLRRVSWLKVKGHLLWRFPNAVLMSRWSRTLSEDLRPFLPPHVLTDETSYMHWFPFNCCFNVPANNSQHGPKHQGQSSKTGRLRRRKHH